MTSPGLQPRYIAEVRWWLYEIAINNNWPAECRYEQIVAWVDRELELRGLGCNEPKSSI